MTGFARGHGVAGPYAWSWEIKSVNAKGLDLRLRLPPGWDAVEVPARTKDLYFVADGTGGHAFAENYDQHQKNVARLRAIESGQTPAPAKQ